MDRACERRHIGLHRDEAPRRQGLALPLGFDRARGLHDDGLPDDVVRVLPDQHLAGSGRLLKARGDVDGVAGRELLVGGRIRPADHDLTGVDPRPSRDSDPVLQVELVVQLFEGVVELDDSSNSALGIVLPDGRHAEDGHRSVADELLHGAAVPLQGRLCRCEVPRHHAAQRLGIEPFAERRRPRHVGKDDRDRLSRSSLVWARLEGRTARAAKPRSGVVHVPALAASHCGSVRLRAPEELCGRVRFEQARLVGEHDRLNAVA